MKRKASRHCGGALVEAATRRLALVAYRARLLVLGKEAVWEARHRCGDVWQATTGMRRRARWKRSNVSPEVGDLSVGGSGVKWVCLAKKRAKCAAAANGEPQ
ncbi:hypothetical protein U1Q18_035333 [Sarracenia purpurea var. burkii]